VRRTHNYASLSGGVGGIWRFAPAWSLAANLGTAWRPPGVNELYNFGVHHGTAQFETGNPNLSGEHQFFYTVGGDVAVQEAVTITITDQDENSLPVGLMFTVAVADVGLGTGTLNVVLSHYDDAPKNGTDRSDETDIDVTFPLTVQ